MRKWSTVSRGLIPLASVSDAAPLPPTAEALAMIRQVVYTSQLQVSDADRTAMLDAISATSTRNNRSAGITGALLISGSLVVQLLEGPHPSIQDLLGRLLQDTRHTDLQIVHDTLVHQHELNIWEMKANDLDVDGVTAKRVREIIEVYRQTFYFQLTDLIEVVRTYVDGASPRGPNA
jgi:hypothetical protein